MSGIPDIAIVGPGKVGTALGILALHAGLNVTTVGGRDARKTRQAAMRIGSSVRACNVAQAGGAGLILITVSDDAIAQVAEELAASEAIRPGDIVAHCSGALPSSVLQPLANLGCHIASIHPLQTFPTVEAALDKLPGTYFFCEGDARAVAVLMKFVATIGGKPVKMNPKGKALYHAAAVMACNYLVTLMDAAQALVEGAGIKPGPALAALEPLVRSTVDNVFAMGPGKALTGPIVRGDIETVRRHMQAIAAAGNKQMMSLYRSLAAATADLSIRSGRIDALRLAGLLEELAVKEATRRKTKSKGLDK